MKKLIGLLLFEVFLLTFLGGGMRNEAVKVRRTNQSKQAIKPKIEFAQAAILWALIDRVYGDALSSKISVVAIMYAPDRVATLLLNIKEQSRQIKAKRYRPEKYDRKSGL